MIRHLFFVVFCIYAFSASAITTVAKQAMIVDMETGAVLFEKRADEPMAPSSMTKIMTAYVIFDALKRGEVSLSTKYHVSEKAFAKGGSKMFLGKGTWVTVSDLLRGLIIQSGNDAAITLAEGFLGSEAAFAKRMNQVARKIGLKNSHFKNPSGWPDPGHTMTARDLVILSQRILRDFPQYYGIFKERSFTWSGIKQINRNPLLGRLQGADGIKTGHTSAGGYGLVASALRDNRRVIMVLNGLKSKEARQDESERLMDWALRTFANYSLLQPGVPIEQAPVWLGKKEKIAVGVAGGLRVTLPKKAREHLAARLAYDAPLAAPVKKGQIIGNITLVAPDFGPVEIPVLALEDVEKLGQVQAFFTGLSQLMEKSL